MEWLFLILIILAVVYIMYDKLHSKKVDVDTDEKISKNEIFPYKTRDDFLSEAERSFYLTLKVFIQDKAVICPKVSQKDIFYVDKSVGKNYMKYFRKISQKHIDFVLCEPNSMKIFCGIELDDSSHNMATRQQRDEFVDKVFENAKLKLIHIPLKRSYSVEDLNSILENFNNSGIKTVTSTNEEISEIETTGSKVCPKCGAKMTLRTSTKGESAGKKFYGCSNYPHCREIVNI